MTAGIVKVIRFNWPKYAVALAIVAAAATSTAAGAAGPVSAVLWAVSLPGLLWTVASVAATWWVYDHRRVYEQLAAGLPELGDWAAVHAGFDDSVPVLRASIGRPPVAVAEIAIDPGPSLRRARRLSRRLATHDRVGRLTLAAGSLDTIFVTFAAHEVRDLAGQRALFRELRAALRPSGQLVVTEHARDLANFAVYGPGAMHFQPLTTWYDRAAEAGMCIASDVTITPFVHRIVGRR